ncbi:MAG: hypothetical protein JO199_03300 [Candidatus Eremiobacteraeota bacterium]|nr:hypothetical protein [Candidatus Eremiobacteraeota bacterium]
MNRSYLRALVATAFLAAFAACSGTPNNPYGSVVNTGGNGNPPTTSLVNATVAISVPSAARTHGVRNHFLSTKMQSLVISLASVNGAAVSGVSASVVNTYAGAKNCTKAGALVCKGALSAAVGTDVFNVTTYSAPNATGSVLSVGSIGAHVSGAGATIGIDEATAAGISAIVASLKMSVTPNSVPRGKVSKSAVSLQAYDAAGGLVTGNSDYAVPIALSIQGDSSNAFLIEGAGTPSHSVTLAKPSNGLAIAYDGNAQASSITLQANVPGTANVSAKADITLQGTPPPPPVGSIYVLNAGQNQGTGATVTEYGGTANGNVAPVHTLQLSSTLYARSIAVDASGNLYVGYFDTPIGAANGIPDSGNEIAVYAPGASGSAQPKAVISYGASATLGVFPQSMAIDPKGNLVTYGVTTISSYRSTVVLAFAPGASGAATPAYSWKYASAPLFRYPGPTGLALDSSGNFYVNGMFVQNGINPDNGIFTNLAADQNNPNSNPARSIPWDSTTGLSPYGTNVSLDASGEIYSGNIARSANGCQGEVAVFAAGASGGTTDTPPLRVIKMQGVATTNPQCSQTTRNPLAGYYPSIAVYGNLVFSTDEFNNAVGAFSALTAGTAKPSQLISGSSTGLNLPIGVAVSSLAAKVERSK